MTFGIIEKEEPLLAELIALAFESAGHDCLVLEDVDHATRILAAVHVDAIVLDMHMPGRSGLDWLESMHPTWPDLPSRTLLITRTPLTFDETIRLRRLGAEVTARPVSIEDVERVVRERLRKVRSAWDARLQHDVQRETPFDLLN